MRLDAGNHVVRITQVNITTSFIIFIFSEYSEIITSRYVQNLSEDKTIYLSKLNGEDYRILTLFEIVHFPSSFPTRICGVVQSQTLKSPVGQSRPMLVVQYTAESTICMNATNLFDILATQYNVIQGDPAEWSALQPTSLSSTPSSRNIDSLVVSLSDELRDT